MTGSELLALRDRLGITAEALANEIGTSPHAVLHVETRKSVSVATASRYAVAAFAIAKRDVAKRESLAAELTTMADAMSKAASLLKAS